MFNIEKMNKCFFAVILACFFSILKIKDGKSLPATNVNTTIFNNGSTTKNTSTFVTIFINVKIFG